MSKIRKNQKPIVGVIMGSESDWGVMKHSAQFLEDFGVPHETRVVSAHRTPDEMFQDRKSVV